MTVAELLVLDEGEGLLNDIRNSHERKLNVLYPNGYGVDESLAVMEEVLSDYCINDVKAH